MAKQESHDGETRFKTPSHHENNEFSPEFMTNKEEEKGEWWMPWL